MKRLLRLLTLLVLFSTIVVVCTAATETVVLQPGPDTGKDKGAYDSDIVPYYTFPYTQFTVLAYTNCNNANANGYLQFDLTGLPTENILNAEIQTYTQVFYNGDGGSWYIDPVIAVREVTSPWDETTLSWDNQPSYDPTILDSHEIDTVGGGSWGNPYYEYYGWLSYDVTDLYSDWVQGIKPNNGVRFSSEVPMCINGDLIWYCESSYESDPSFRPKLVITYETSPALPPDVSQAYPSKGTLWPANNKYADITIEGVTDPDDEFTLAITAITSDESTTAGGKNKAPDADPACIGTDTARIRAERNGNGNGRVYEIIFVATDSMGAQSVGSVKVCVPHDQGKGSGCSDDGQLYDATGIN
jgi:hypothetical protein